jgi:hypothetical protein
MSVFGKSSADVDTMVSYLRDRGWLELETSDWAGPHGERLGLFDAFLKAKEDERCGNSDDS